jgi:hypothetical protein
VSTVTPAEVLKEVAESVPSGCLENIIIVGSVAAGYALLEHNERFQVRTKDIDCVLSPRKDADQAGTSIAEKLISAGWHPRADGEFGQPGNSETPDDKLPAVRLYPPESTDWFIELLAEPDAATQSSGKTWMRIVVNGGHYGLPSFQYLAIATHNPQVTDYGLYCARPEMMALALLLEHPHISSQTISGLIADREIKRSNKDLGRVLAIAYLSLQKDENALLAWPGTWISALRSLFKEDWKQLGTSVGTGLHELLANSDDLEQAQLTCNVGLLASDQLTLGQLRDVGNRLMQDVVDQVRGLSSAA